MSNLIRTQEGLKWTQNVNVSSSKPQIQHFRPDVEAAAADDKSELAS